MSGRGGAGGRGGPAGPPAKVSNLDGEAPDSTDFANYFCTYAYLYHQKDMLEDHKRTGAYYNACMQNRAQFAGKVVLDVGTGSGILAIFAAKAGARKVYAVEATDMAKFAKRLVTAQGLDGTVEVIQGVIESVDIPEKVDIIISEWMGYFLLRESMLDSVLVARDKFLKPGGALYPSHARMFMAPIRSNQCRQRHCDFQNSMEGWAEFLDEMKQYYGVTMDCLSDDYRQEQLDYFSKTAAWTDVHPSQVVGSAACFKAYDLHTVTLEELKAPLKASFQMRVLEDGPVDAFCGWFDTQFKGSEQNPTTTEVTLSTAPDPTGATHWGQQSFFLHPPVECAEGDVLSCDIEVVRRKDNQRLMDVLVRHRVEGRAGSDRTSAFHIE
ncbi:arginine N-methyltransferase [Chlorella sorokiniana]|uniref:Arginine N-methyltransferase n=1 Tax=Chlorella sorokiniana TaxID=3076 RepID=A0A2P6TS12_CHLSO|nr:arginine N-methyltransferase [Chlorella sorokiniana]|eukprot:PRW56855.1 arginine N-methyltransferase [Chlorella sorokiniana]